MKMNNKHNNKAEKMELMPYYEKYGVKDWPAADQKELLARLSAEDILPAGVKYNHHSRALIVQKSENNEIWYQAESAVIQILRDIDADIRALQIIKNHLWNAGMELNFDNNDNEPNKITRITFWSTHLSLQHDIYVEWNTEDSAKKQIEEIHKKFYEDRENFDANAATLEEIRNGYDLSVRELLEDTEEIEATLEHTAGEIVRTVRYTHE